DHTEQPIIDSRLLEQLQKAMRDQLLYPQQGREMQTARLQRQLKHFPIATRVNFSISPKGLLTIMEVTAQDRQGLLYQVALALKHCHANLVAAKVATYGERAEDIFFINSRERQPLTDPVQLNCLESEIVRRLEPASTATKAHTTEF
ncbi:MAG TPA: hypothetical protein VIR61_01960, partial [Sulfuricaulis sp.]